MNSARPTTHAAAIRLILAVAIAHLPMVAMSEDAGHDESGHAGHDAQSTTVPAEHGEDEHADADDHEGHAEASPTDWTDAQIAKAGISIANAGPGRLVINKSLSGQVLLNADRLAHVATRVDGLITRVNASVGQSVKAGQPLASISSRDYEDLRADYLASSSRLALARVTYKREDELWRQRISAEQDFLAAKQAMAEARISHRQARQKLRAIGLSDADLDGIEADSGQSTSELAVVSPMAGTVIEKHATIGEVAHTEESLFTVADMSTVWVDLSVFAKDLSVIAAGQNVSLSITGTDLRADGVISYVQPVADVGTRAVLARVVLPNDDGRFRPGSFVSASVAIAEVEVPILVPKAAVQTVDGKPTLFVRTEHGFEARPVSLGRQDDTSIEISAGLTANEPYVAAGAFIVKADLEKAGAAHEH